jgi:hypothetical protein
MWERETANVIACHLTELLLQQLRCVFIRFVIVFPWQYLVKLNDTTRVDVKNLISFGTLQNTMKLHVGNFFCQAVVLYCSAFDEIYKLK